MMDNKFRNLVRADRPPRVGTLLGTLVECARNRVFPMAAHMQAPAITAVPRSVPTFVVPFGTHAIHSPPHADFRLCR